MEDSEDLRRLLSEKTAEAEQAYSELYDARDAITMIACYSGAKEYFVSAIAIAQRLGLIDVQQQLEAHHPCPCCSGDRVVDDPVSPSARPAPAPAPPTEPASAPNRNLRNRPPGGPSGSS
jgi:hypothetical protein